MAIGLTIFSSLDNLGTMSNNEGIPALKQGTDSDDTYDLACKEKGVEEDKEESSNSKSGSDDSTEPLLSSPRNTSSSELKRGGKGYQWNSIFGRYPGKPGMIRNSAPTSSYQSVSGEGREEEGHHIVSIGANHKGSSPTDANFDIPSSTPGCFDVFGGGCYRRNSRSSKTLCQYDENLKRTVDDDLLNSSKAYFKWKVLLTPIMYLTGRRVASQESYEKKMQIQQAELQAISAESEFKMKKFTNFIHFVTGSSKGLIHPLSTFTKLWQSLVAATFLFSCMEAPFNATFTPINDDGRITTSAEVIHMFVMMFVYFVYVADIFVKMRTGYNKLGAIVMDKKLIANYYRNHGLISDCIAAIPVVVLPFEILSSILCTRRETCPPPMLRYSIRYLKCLQLFKLKSALTMLNVIEESVADTTNTLLTSLTSLLLFFIVLTNWFTCIWFLAQAYPINFEPGSHHKPLTLYQSWLGSQAKEDPIIKPILDRWVAGEAKLSDNLILYINCFYWSSSAGDAYNTQNTSEKFVAILAQIIVENGFMAFILASIISALEEFSRGRKKHGIYRSKIDAVNEFMRSEAFPPNVTESVREFYKYVWLPQQIDFTEATLHEELPNYLRTDVMSRITKKVLLTSKFMSDYFKDVPLDDDPRNAKLQWIKMISEMLIPRFFIASQYVMRQGDIGTEFYIIKQGKVAVEIGLEPDEVKVVSELGPGSYMGDIALLGLNTKRTASIRTITNCIIFELKQEDMKKIWEVYPTLKMYMMDVAQKTKMRTNTKKESEDAKDVKEGTTSSKGHFGQHLHHKSHKKHKDKAIFKMMPSKGRHGKREPHIQFERTKSTMQYKAEIEALEDEIIGQQDDK